MGLARNQEMPSERHESAPWTSRLLYSAGATIKGLAAVFRNSLEGFLALNMLVVAVGEIFDRPLSWFFYVTGVVLLLAVLIERAFAGMGDVSAPTAKE